MSGTHDSGEDSRAESEFVGNGRSDSATRISTWLDVRSSREGLDMDAKELFLVIRSRISMRIGVLWENDPPALTSRREADSVSSPKKKC